MQNHNPLGQRGISRTLASQSQDAPIPMGDTARRRPRWGRGPLLLLLLLAVMPGALHAAAPVIQTNQVLWASVPTTNLALVGGVSLARTNAVSLPLSFRILSGVPSNPFSIETYSNYWGLVKLANSSDLALASRFDLSVAATNATGGHTNSVIVIAPGPFVVAERSSTNSLAGPIVTGSLTNTLRFAVDTNGTTDARALEALTVTANGEIRVANGLALDFETQTNYWLGVIMTNLATTNATSGRVLIVVANVNETPQFADQSFTLPEDREETFIGALKAADPEHDALRFQIASLEVSGVTNHNVFFEIRNGTNLHLKASGLGPPAKSVLTVVVTEDRTDGQPSLINQALVTVEAPKTYSRFGIPLLLPVKGHEGGAPDGLPIQAVAAGTNQDVYVVGVDANKQAYLQMLPGGLYGDPKQVALRAQFVPTALAAAGPGLYIAGSLTDSNQAVVYRYSTNGLPQATNYLRFGTTNCYSVTDLLEDGGKVYLCGGGGATPSAMRPYWAELNGSNLTFAAGSPRLIQYVTGDIPGGAREVRWGVATAIAKEAGKTNVFLAGYWKFTWDWYYYANGWDDFWNVKSWTYTSGRCTFLAAPLSASVTAVKTVAKSKDNNEVSGDVITRLRIADDGGSIALFAVQETAAKGVRKVEVKKYDTGLKPVAGSVLSITSTDGDVRAESLTVADEMGSKVLYLAGVIPGGCQSRFETGALAVDLYPSGDRLFLAKLGLDLKLSQGWSPPLLLSQYNYVPAGGVPLQPLGAEPAFSAPPLGPRAPHSIVVPYAALGGVLLAGNIASGTLTLSQSGNENSLTAEASRNAGFVTLVKTNKTFEVPLFLETVSEFGESGVHVRPLKGPQMAVAGKTYTVEVLSPLYVRLNGSYIGSLDDPPTDQQIKNEALTRYVCTGYTVADTDIIGNSPSYTFQFSKNTKITFHWTVEHALEIKSDLTGTGAFPDGNGGYTRNPTTFLGLTSLAAGNPSPEVKKHWVKENELVTPFIDGTVPDLSAFETRYVGAGYIASGYAVTNLGHTPVTNAFAAIQTRQQIPQFAMGGPAAITYLWGVQHRVQVSTSTLESQGWPGIKVVDDPSQPDRTGSGEFWFNRHTHLILGGRETNKLSGALMASGDLRSDCLGAECFTNQFAIQVEPDAPQDYMGAEVASLSQGTTVSWNYGEVRIGQTVVIGEPVVLSPQTVPNAGLLAHVNTNKAPAIQTQTSPPGSTDADMCEWDQVARRSYPVRPGVFLLRYERDDNTNLALTFIITSRLPAAAHYGHLVHPEMPPVHLDPDPNDDRFFLKLAFTTNAVANGSEFVATNRDASVLVFSRSESNAVPYRAATGDRLREMLYVRVVATTPWTEGPGGFDPANPARTRTWIGARVTSTNDTAGIGTGFIAYTNARYNAAIYARGKTADAGPIIPVNRHFRVADATHDLVVIWYQRKEAILWPYMTERFDPQWPVALDPARLPDPLPDVETMSANGTNYLRRIVIASRLGSESRDHALRDQLSFTPPRYEQVAIYNQPYPSRPGFNPNEEHAVVAPSFKYLDQASPPAVAYALRNSYNRTDHDSGHTSDPYVLVQYLDHGADLGPGELKMAVYAIEKEDDRWQLNPDRHTNAVSGVAREFPYIFHYPMNAAEPVQPPYPLNLVIGLSPCVKTSGSNISPQRVYWEDYRGQPWAVSAGDFRSGFYYPLPAEFSVPDAAKEPPGTCILFETAGGVVVTGTNQNPNFRAGDQFAINDTVVTINGTSAEKFCADVNRALGNKVAACVLASGEIRLRALNTDRLVLKQRLTGTPLASAGLPVSTNLPTPAVRYTAAWPDAVPILKAGETLTFAGGEYKADYPAADGLPGVIGWAAGEVIYDSLNPAMNSAGAFSKYTARLIAPLEERSVTLTASDAAALVEKIQPATKVTRAKGARWQFAGLPASLGKRISYDPVNRRLALKGFLNDKTLGDPALTAAPPPLYVLEPNILTRDESNTLYQLVALGAWQKAVTNLYALSRNPAALVNSASPGGGPPYFAGLDQEIERDASGTPALDPSGKMRLLGAATAAPLRGLGPGLALAPSPQFLDPTVAGESYVTLAENNNLDIGGRVTLHIVKVSKNYRYRGAIKTILADNAFAEQVTLRHSGDFGANADDIVYQWFYREEDGTESTAPPGGPWQLFPDQSGNALRGLAMYQINLEGSGGLLLADNLFFVRYRHKNDQPPAGANSSDWTGTAWDTDGRLQTTNSQVVKVGSQWAGAANSPTVDGQYQPQLMMGWIKRVLDRINPFEARISDFRNNSAPATYASMIQELGPHYEGPVALNPDKNVIENTGLIELYETVLDRGMDLSINLSSPVNTVGVNTALQLAATRLSDFYMLLGNEAYADAQAPTIAYGDAQMDFSTDFGEIASSMFCFQNQVGSLLEEELALLRGVSQSYGRPVYNRLFWNFTKSLGEAAYAVNYDITDYNRDGFINESDAMALYPQGHGDAWGHYLTAIKSQYRLLQHPYYNWHSRAEQYNLLDVVVSVDFLDERRFAEAAAARAKAGAQIVSLTYRARYVEDPDGQWQGYTDTDANRAWGVDGWARRAGQGALFDWMTANALIPSQDTNVEHNALEKIDRGTVTALQTLSAELGEIQSQYDNANNGLNPLGLAADVVPFDIDATFNAVGSTAQIGRPAVQGLGHFSQIYERAVKAVNNARGAFDSANFMQSRLRQNVESADSFRQEVIEQDLDFRNRLIEIFGTPYDGQIGSGKAYPAGYYGPDLMLFMYVDVNSVNGETVPPASTSFTTQFAGFKQEILSGNGDTGVDDFKNTINTYFKGDLAAITNTGQFNLAQNSILTISNLPVAASGYAFRAQGWGRRASPGELQSIISDMVQAEADLELAEGDYQQYLIGVVRMVDLLTAKHGLSSITIDEKKYQKTVQWTLGSLAAGLKVWGAFLTAAKEEKESMGKIFSEALPTVTGVSFDGTSIMRFSIELGQFIGAMGFRAAKLAAIGDGEFVNVITAERLAASDITIQKAGFTYELQQQLTELEQSLRGEPLLRIEAFKRLEALRQVSDRYRRTLESGSRLLDERQVFNIKTAGVTQKTRYQDMAFRVFRNDALQKYRAAYDLAARYTYMAAKAFDYETNLSPEDRGSAEPVLTDIIRARTLGILQNGEPAIGRRRSGRCAGQLCGTTGACSPAA